MAGEMLPSLLSAIGGDLSACRPAKRAQGNRPSTAPTVSCASLAVAAADIARNVQTIDVLFNDG